MLDRVLDRGSASQSYRTKREQRTGRCGFRLEDLRAWHLVEASCRRCRHKATIAHELLLRGRPSYTRLSDIERALRCQRCGARGHASLAVRARPRD